MTAASRTLGPTDRPRPEFSCPTCDRPALVAAPDEIVDWRCGACGQRVTEAGGEA